MAIVSTSKVSFASCCDIPVVSFHSHTFSKLPIDGISINSSSHKHLPPKKRILSKNLPVITCSSYRHKLVRDPRLDKHVAKQNKIRFVQKLKTLLLSKPKHFIPIHILHKCRSYLCLPKPLSMILMINRYPTIFELFYIPAPALPINAAGPLTQLCVRLTPAAASLAKRESDFKRSIAASLVTKLQKLLMLASPYHRILLSKLVHLGPDLGLPVNFRSRLCNDHPDKFKVVDTSYGRALELVSWDSNLATVIPSRDEVESLGLIVDRPLKFEHLRLRKGLNVKRSHRDYLIKFKEVPDVCPYTTNVENLVKESIEAEKRACAVVREILGMTVEKRTLVDHLTHFRKEFGLPNKLRGMLIRHPELFYVSIKGQRDSVFLVEGYNEKGAVLVKDETLMLKDQLFELVREGKRVRREKKRGYHFDGTDKSNAQTMNLQVDHEDYDDYDDGLDDLFQLEESGSEGDVKDLETEETIRMLEKEEFWTIETPSFYENGNDSGLIPW
ncbi:protein ROOT PRIMORDIUM DEFECTIVE 1 [Dorcoceras hygrometricum]|uniref:Protein ROOT PRIMORDIUM DEFECTIVE 1 n=1 Tax=Dorcoceras hygrometricum TaxID=472368 RepID=A0A2Z7CTK5_9LAMI|nr:protein ROOT PRIMORDIUM DEFECTIVE 1 [Dorcoceras hygrometricum]